MVKLILPLVILTIFFLLECSYNAPEVYQVVRRCHLGPSTLKVHFWIYKLVKLFTTDS
jgi:hypothetical protein